MVFSFAAFGDEEFPFTETFSSTEGRNRRHIGHAQSVVVRPGYRYVSWCKRRKSAQKSAFQVAFPCKKPTLFSVSGNRIATAKKRCRAAGPPQGNDTFVRGKAIHRRIHACLGKPMPGIVRSSTRTRYHSAASTIAAKAMPACRGSGPGARSRFGELWPLHLRSCR